MEGLKADKLKAIAMGITAVFLPMAAQAYVGPGAGLSLIGALWALILAVLTVIFFIVVFPIRLLLRRLRDEKQAVTDIPDTDNVVIFTRDEPSEKHIDNDLKL